MTNNSENKELIHNALILIDEWNQHLKPILKNEKLKKMAQSPFYFFRGTNHLFWQYFTNDKRLQEFSTNNALTWIQGDLHAYNYGIYGNDEGELVYGLNDFDESCIANYQFDLWRMAASMVLIAKENEFTSNETITSFIDSFSSAYANLFSKCSINGRSVLQQVSRKNAYGKLDETIEQVEKKESRKEMLLQWTVNKGNPAFNLSYDKLKPLNKEKAEEVKAAMPSYLKTLDNYKNFEADYFNILDVAQRISSGTGSYGTPRYYVLIKGKAKGTYEERILDIKLQYKPAPYGFSDVQFKKKYDDLFVNEGQRHKAAYLALNYYTDSHLGWMKLSEGIFSVRERSPYKSYFPSKLLNTENRFNKLAEQWGYILACAHIKAESQFNVKEIWNLINNDQQGFSKLVSRVAIEYADYNNEVYKSFMNKLFLNE